MENMTTLRIDLGISAQKIAQQIIINNENIEQQITKGIELALKEFTDENKFIEHVKSATKKTIEDTIKESVNSWSFQKKLKESIESKISEKIRIYSEEVSDKILKNI